MARANTVTSKHCQQYPISALILDYLARCVWQSAGLSWARLSRPSCITASQATTGPEVLHQSAWLQLHIKFVASLPRNYQITGSAPTKNCKIIISVADPGPSCLLDPGWVKKSRSGSGMNIPDHISESSEPIFRFKILIPDPQHLRLPGISKEV
jgi:hypothetical protein